MIASGIRLVTVTLLFLLSASAVLAETTPPDEGVTWRKRSGTGEPATREEKLAMELIRRRERQLKIGPYSVQFDGVRGENTQVSVRLSGRGEDVDTVSRFLVKEGRIVAYADPVYEQEPQKVDPRRRERALMIARQTSGGEAPDRPIIYDGFVYVAEIDDCKAVVTEKNTDREIVGTYEFDLCQ